jgi:hypothetical protein
MTWAGGLDASTAGASSPLWIDDPVTLPTLGESDLPQEYALIECEEPPAVSLTDSSTDPLVESDRVTEPTVDPVSVSCHVADIDAQSIPINKSKWNASVTVHIIDGSGQPVQNAIVAATWGGGYGGSTVCTTDGAGQCEMTTGKLTQDDGDVICVIDRVSHAALTYEPAGNTDPDGDSDGTTIVIGGP